MTDPASLPSAVEANFDGLVGPTHNYAGLAAGDGASARNADSVSNPREAALQGLAKMRRLAALGLPQAVLPPQERPYLPALRKLGFTGRDSEVLRVAQRDAPQLLAELSSASSAWIANAATVSPSADTADRRVHFTPANLATHSHRANEPQVTGRALATIFRDDEHFVHHAPLAATPQLGDEGAANHLRFCAEHGHAGLELFVYGAAGEDDPRPTAFPARQTRAASEAVIRLHTLDAANCLLAQQRPAAIDAGVLHNEVIAVGHRELLLTHELAYVDADPLRDWLRRQLIGRSPIILELKDKDLPLAEAIESGLFNSQIVTLPDGSMRLVCTTECRERRRSWAAITRIVEDRGNPIEGVEVFDLRQSLSNGGGPARLRLRVVLTEAERAAVSPKVWIDDTLATTLETWVRRHYRDRLAPRDLADPQLLDESRTALDSLTQILGLGSLYDFQR